jgi:hypothetical protein
MLCCKAVYGGRLWRPVLILEFARLVLQSFGTSALLLSYAFVDLYIFYYYYYYYHHHHHHHHHIIHNNTHSNRKHIYKSGIFLLIYLR